MENSCGNDITISLPKEILGLYSQFQSGEEVVNNKKILVKKNKDTYFLLFKKAKITYNIKALEDGKNVFIFKNMESNLLVCGAYQEVEILTLKMNKDLNALLQV